MFSFKKTSDVVDIDIFTVHKGLSQLDECQPQPASKFFPEWFKEVPRFVDDPEYSKGSIKNCPVFAEYLTQGFIIPMWCDTIIRSDDKGWHFETSAEEFKWEIHPNFQYLDFLPKNTDSEKFLTLKAICPWYVKTPPGYSVYQKQMYYHFQDYKVLPGSINTDYHRTINQQVLVEKGKEIFIPRGTPFAWYIPYKRENYKFNTRLANDNDMLDLERSIFDTRSKFLGSYKHRKKKS